MTGNETDRSYAGRGLRPDGTAASRLSCRGISPPHTSCQNLLAATASREAATHRYVSGRGMRTKGNGLEGLAAHHALQKACHVDDVHVQDRCEALLVYASRVSEAHLVLLRRQLLHVLAGALLRHRYRTPGSRRRRSTSRTCLFHAANALSTSVTVANTQSAGTCPATGQG